MSSSRRNSLSLSNVDNGNSFNCSRPDNQAGDRASRLQVNLQQTKYTVVREATARAGYDEANEMEEHWDLTWSDLSVTVDKVAMLKPYQKLNHFPSMLEICRKSALSKHMAKMASRLPHEYSFYPLSFMLPKQLDDLLAVLRKNKLKMDQGDLQNVQTFILKPSSGAQGKGIQLIQTVAQLQGVDVSNMIAQRYIGKPLLVDGLKFDLRIYALVLSVDPLRVFLYDEGLARMATTPYEPPSKDNLSEVTMHLTNYAVNKGATGFVPSSPLVGPEESDGCINHEGNQGGTKRLASSVLLAIANKRGYPYSKLVDDISGIVSKSIMAVQPLLAHTYHTALAAGSSRESTLQASSCPCLSIDHSAPEGCSCTCPPSQCFEVLGFDIMLDDNLKPWLLEVNHSPSFSCDETIDHQVKGALISDTLLALSQKPDSREKYLEAQQTAVSHRLYSPASNSSLRRPLSGLTRKKSYSITAETLEDLLEPSPGSSSNLSSLYPSLLSSRPSSAAQRPSSAWGRSSISILSNNSSQCMTQRPSLGGPGFLIGPQKTLKGAAAASSCDSQGLDHLSFSSFSSSTCIGNFTQIFPSTYEDSQIQGQAASANESIKTNRARHLAILLAASDNFPDQRCSCNWCSKRMRRRYMSSGLQQLMSSSSSPSCPSLSLPSRPKSCTLGRSSEPSPRPALRPFASELRSLSSIDQGSIVQAEEEEGQPLEAMPNTQSMPGLPPKAPSSRSSSPSTSTAGKGSSSMLGHRPRSSRMRSAVLTSRGSSEADEDEDTEEKDPARKKSFGRSTVTEGANNVPLHPSPSSTSAFLSLTERRMAALKSKTSFLLSDRGEDSGYASKEGPYSARKGGLGSAIRRRT